MRPRTKRRLRVGVLCVVAVLVAAVAGSAVAVAGGHGGPGGPGGPGDPNEKCYVDQFGGVYQDGGVGGSTTRDYTINGTVVTVHFSWTADKHLSVWATNGVFTSLMVKCGNNKVYPGPMPGAGPFAVYVPNPTGNNGLAMSHMDFCLKVTPAPTTTEPPRGSLKVYKDITGDRYGKWPSNFSFTVTGPDFSETYTFQNDDWRNGHRTISDLEPGVYTVTENTPGYPFSVSGEGSVEVFSDQRTKVTITNYGSTTTTLAKGHLRITKCISGDNPEDLDYEDFCVTVTGPNDYSWSGCFDKWGNIWLWNLEPGVYTVDESDPGYPFMVTGEGQVEVKSWKWASAKITNNGSTTTTVRPVGSLKITKSITGDNPEEASCEDFYVTVTGPNEYNWYGNFDGDCEINLEGLEPGEYTITEDEPGYPFTASGGGGVQVVAEEQTGVTITNNGSTTTLAGSLRITKTITGDNPDGLTYEDFTVVVTGPAPDSTVVFDGTFDEFGEIVITGLVPGDYTVTEEALGYPWTIEGNGAVVVAPGEETLAEITNTGSTSTTAALVTSTTGGQLTSSTGGTGTTGTTQLTGTTGTGSDTTVFGFSDTTVFGWVAQPDDVQTGEGGMAGGNGALIILVLASTLLAGVLVASTVGVRAGVL